MGETLLNVNDISYVYHTKSGETPALSHISFSVPRGEFTAIVGPSGCGNAMWEQRKLFYPHLFSVPYCLRHKHGSVISLFLYSKQR